MVFLYVLRCLYSGLSLASHLMLTASWSLKTKKQLLLPLRQRFSRAFQLQHMKHRQSTIGSVHIENRTKLHENHSVFFRNETVLNSQSYKWIITITRIMKCSLTKEHVWGYTDKTAHRKTPCVPSTQRLWNKQRTPLKSRCDYLWQAHASQKLLDSLLDLWRSGNLKMTVHR